MNIIGVMTYGRTKHSVLSSCISLSGYIFCLCRQLQEGETDWRSYVLIARLLYLLLGIYWQMRKERLKHSVHFKEELHTIYLQSHLGINKYFSNTDSGDIGTKVETWSLNQILAPGESIGWYPNTPSSFGNPKIQSPCTWTQEQNVINCFRWCWIPLAWLNQPLPTVVCPILSSGIRARDPNSSLIPEDVPILRFRKERAHTKQPLNSFNGTQLIQYTY